MMPRTRTTVLAALLAAAPAVVLVGPPSAAAAVTCDGAPATVLATESGQTLDGTEGDDVISTAGFADVTVDALGGDDLVCASRGTVVYPGAGDDTILGAVDVVLAYDRPDGGDVAQPGVAPVTIDVAAGTVEGMGHDTFTGAIRSFRGTGNGDLFVGSDDADTFIAPRGTGEAVVRSAGGDDHVLVAFGTVWAGEGDDRVWVDNGTVHGEGGDDQLLAKLGGELRGGPGDDVVQGRYVRMADDPDRRAGTFVLLGGPGDDHLIPPSVFRPWLPECGEWRRNCMVVARGGLGHDHLDLSRLHGGGARVDLRRNMVTHPRIRGVISTVEDVTGTRGADRLTGDGGPNRLVGGLTGHEADVIHGRGGDDILVARSPGARLDGGTGSDRCTGGRQARC